MKKTLYWGEPEDKKLKKVAYKLRKYKVSQSQVARTAIRIATTEALENALLAEIADAQ
jgi:hypothetical protein